MKKPDFSTDRNPPLSQMAAAGACRNQAATLEALAGLLVEVAQARRSRAAAGLATWATVADLEALNAAAARLVARAHPEFSRDYARADDEDAVIFKVLDAALARAQAAAKATR